VKGDQQRTDPLVGTVLDGVYRVTRLLGKGGMGAVYEAVHTRLANRVAIKVMSRELAANPQALARFHREAQVTSQLGHPNIVHVFDFGTAPEGQPFLAMELLQGEDLEQRILRVGRLPPAAVAGIVRQTASALAATHAKGIVHRDLKPANIFLLHIEGADDFVKVVDFGISKVRAAATRLTQGAVVMGTPQFMSPEQASGRVDDIDHATDQWALAAVAFEALSGRGPFVGDEVATLLYQIVHEPPATLSSVAPQLPDELGIVLTKALSKSPRDRFTSITAFAQAFEVAALTPKANPTLAYADGARDQEEMTVFENRTAGAGAGTPGSGSQANLQTTTFSRTAGELTPPGADTNGGPPLWRRPAVLVATGMVLLAAVLLFARGLAPRMPPTSTAPASALSAAAGTATAGKSPVAATPISAQQASGATRPGKPAISARQKTKATPNAKTNPFLAPSPQDSANGSASSEIDSRAPATKAKPAARSRSKKKLFEDL
jgi:serine/threonine protein kinase